LGGVAGADTKADNLQRRPDSRQYLIHRQSETQGPRHVLHANGTQGKTPVYYGSANEPFMRAIEDVRAHWRAHRGRFLREIGT